MFLKILENEDYYDKITIYKLFPLTKGEAVEVKRNKRKTKRYQVSKRNERRREDDGDI